MYLMRRQKKRSGSPRANSEFLSSIQGETTMTSVLNQLEKMTVIVADTGDAAMVEQYKPMDCTTNPSLVLAAFNLENSQDVINQEISQARAAGSSAEQLCDTLTVAIGAKLSTLIPGRVSTEVDAALSFDKDGSVKRALDIVADYDRRGVSKDRILIKLAATWEGIAAAKILEQQGINCNLTLLFSIDQAKACADAGVFLISPFVGRITDWYKKAENVEAYAPDDDPGVQSVRTIYDLYKTHGIQTIVMGASFRNTDQIKALAGCDRLTISPSLLSSLANDTSPLSRKLDASQADQTHLFEVSEKAFRWGLNQDAMATEKLSEGIRKFDADHKALLSLLTEKLG